MPTSASLRKQIEHALEKRFPAALTPVRRTIREMAPTGISEVDELLNGGLPIGAISEVTGPDSSGRTSLAMAFVAQRMNPDQVCAWVDAGDAFDPESAAASGVCLKRLLWVRCSASDRQTHTKPWARLDQALRAADLLLQVGGFAAIVLDFGGIAPEYGNRIPLSSWFRFLQAADRTRCCLIVLGKAPYAQSSASVVLECLPKHNETNIETTLRRCTFDVHLRRERFGHLSAPMRKPPASTWSAIAAREQDDCA
jgi:hypothetical protein